LAEKAPALPFWRGPALVVERGKILAFLANERKRLDGIQPRNLKARSAK